MLNRALLRDGRAMEDEWPVILPQGRARYSRARLAVSMEMGCDTVVRLIRGGYPCRKRFCTDVLDEMLWGAGVTCAGVTCAGAGR